MATGITRRENLQFLVGCHGTQTDLAKALSHKTLTQPIISSILRRKRPLHVHEARDLEQILGIPNGWLDRYTLRKAWRLIRQFGTLDASTQGLVNALLTFATEQK